MRLTSSLLGMGFDGEQGTDGSSSIGAFRVPWRKAACHRMCRFPRIPFEVAPDRHQSVRSEPQNWICES
jgi:hypothetical protein